MKPKDKEKFRTAAILLFYILQKYYLIVLYCGRVPADNAPGCTAAEGLLYKPWSFLLAPPGVSTRDLSSERTLVVKGGTTWARNGRWILPETARLPRNIHGSFTCRKSTTWDKRLYFPSEGRRAEDFFSLKNPTASAGFEPANLGTKGQHATSRPTKPLTLYVTIRRLYHAVFQYWHSQLSAWHLFPPVI